MTGLSTLLQAGQPLLLIRKLHGGQLSRLAVANTLWISVSNVMLLSGIATIIIAIISRLILEPSSSLGWIWTLLIPTTTMTQASSFYRGIGNSNKGSLLEPGIILTMTSIYISLSPQSDARSVWDVMSVIAWISLIMTAIDLMKTAGIRKRNIRLSLAYFIEARTLAAITSLSFLAQWGGLILIVFLSDDAEAARVNAIFRILTPMQFLITSIDMYLAPRLIITSGSHLLDIRNFGRIYGLALATPYAIVFIFFKDFSLMLLYGNVNIGGAGFLDLLIISGIAQIAIGCNGTLLSMKHKERVVLIGTLLRLFINFALIIVLHLMNQPAAFYIAFAISVLAQSTHQWHHVNRLFRIEAEES